MSDNIAVLDGYTKTLFASGGAHDLVIMVRPDVDLDGTFKAWDTDEQEFIRVNGWLWTFAGVA